MTATREILVVHNLEDRPTRDIHHLTLNLRSLETELVMRYVVQQLHEYLLADFTFRHLLQVGLPHLKAAHRGMVITQLVTRILVWEGQSMALPTLGRQCSLASVLMNMETCDQFQYPQFHSVSPTLRSSSEQV